MSTCLAHLKRLTFVKLVENHPEEDINYSDFINIMQALFVYWEQVQNYFYIPSSPQ